MGAIKAYVRNGRIVVDVPTDLPDGTPLLVLPVPEGDDLDDEERAALHAAIEEAQGELDAGLVVSEDELWERLRSIP